MPSVPVLPRADRLAVAFALALALLAGACAHDEYVWVADFPRSAPPQVGEYVVAPGDVLSIRVWNQDGMSGKVRVRSDGKISLPFLNDVMAAGYKPDVLAQQIQVRVKDFLTTPVVTVSLEEVKPLTVSVLGEVSKAGQYGLEPGAGVLNALATAGGLTDYAHRDRVFVLRDVGGKPARIRFDYRELAQAQGPAAAFRLQSGDVVVVE
jgi:polysaccharide export outer membrane protein